MRAQEAATSQAPSPGSSAPAEYSAGISIIDSAGYFAAANEEFSRLVGFTPDELAGRHITSLVPADRRETARARIEKILSGTELPSFEDGFLMHRSGRMMATLRLPIRRVELGGHTFFVMVELHGADRDRWISSNPGASPAIGGAILAFDETGFSVFTAGAALPPNALIEPHLLAVLGGESRTVELSLGDRVRQLRFLPLRHESKIVGGLVLLDDGHESVVDSRQQMNDHLAPTVLDAVLAAVNEAVVAVGLDGTVGYRNAAAHRILGDVALPLAGRSDAGDRRTWLREDGMPLEHGQSPIARCLESGSAVRHRVLGLVDQHGQVTWLNVNAQPVRSRSGQRVIGAVASFAEITHFRDIEERVVQQALYDGLTGLPNRSLFTDRIRATTGNSTGTPKTFAIAIVDLDHFKQVNDSLGHAAGDQLLREVAGRLKARVGEGDTLARLGGDEFALLLPAVGDGGLAQITGNALLRSLAAPFFLDKREVFVSASIGISLYPADGDDVETLLRRADAAMYRAKAAGRDNVQVFERAMDAAARERFELDSNLHHATDRRELLLHYQPQVDLITGELVGAEALLRWQHPQLGLLLPERFISLAEENGLITGMGEWALFDACKQAAAWKKMGAANKVSVNVSAVQFRRADFVEMVIRALSTASLDPSLLELELTESVVMRDVSGSAAQLARLRNLGVAISIDDFGTGYSSLGYLHRLPIDVLKIDRAFVQAVGMESNALSLVRAMTGLAKSLGLSVIAEGIETDLQRNALRDAGCQHGQGFLFARPLPADVFEKVWLRPADPPPLKQ